MEHIENDKEFNGLTVNGGVNQPPQVNPYITRRRRKPLPTAAELTEGILRGDTTLLSLSLIHI